MNIAIIVKVLSEVNADVFAAVVTALELALANTSLEDFGCLTAVDCWLFAAFNCARALQACMPSYQL